ncbi:MAG: O-methyltransferase [Rikenellaceae bacterium]
MDKLLDLYIKEHSSDELNVLKELDRTTNLLTVQPRMISGHIQGLVLKMFVAMLKPKRILEIGTFTGYSAICLASGLEQGTELHTIDINDEISYIPEQAFEKSGFKDKIFQHIGSALDVVPRLGGTFELVFMDGDKREYLAYYNMLFDGGYVTKGSIILADNVLWDGKVTDKSPKNLKDTYTKGILEFNEFVKNDSRVEIVILPMRDGMSIIRVL